MKNPNNGFVLVDKPAGLTSQQAVQRVRKALGADRAGHTGTLDPFATGLLLVLLGRATRLAPHVLDEPKEYEALIRFGVETDTDDATGTPSREAALPSRSAVEQATVVLTGDIEQTPPAFSAKHVAGRRAYELARRGAAPTLAPVRVHVVSWRILAQDDATLRARIVCGGGTYIRALARELGRLTNSAAHCAELRRLRCGAFSVADAVLPDAATAQDVRAPLAAVAGLPIQNVDAAAALGVAHGRAIAATVDGAWSAVVADDGDLIAIAQRADSSWHPKVVLIDPSRLTPRTQRLTSA